MACFIITAATERVTLYCTWRPSALTIRPRRQVQVTYMYIENSMKLRDVMDFEMCEQTDMQTYRHAYRNTSLTCWGEVKIQNRIRIEYYVTASPKTVRFPTSLPGYRGRRVHIPNSYPCTHTVLLDL